MKKERKRITQTRDKQADSQTDKHRARGERREQKQEDENCHTKNSAAL